MKTIVSDYEISLEDAGKKFLGNEEDPIIIFRVDEGTSSSYTNNIYKLYNREGKYFLFDIKRPTRTWDRRYDLKELFEKHKNKGTFYVFKDYKEYFNWLKEKEDNNEL